MRWSRLVTMTCATTITLGTAFAIPAAADTDPWPVDYTAPEDQITPDAFAQEKMAEAILTSLATPGQTAESRKSGEAELRALPPKAVAKARANLGLAPEDNADGTPRALAGATSPLAAIPASKYLTMPHATQIKGYYCGPASAYMALAAMKKTRSKSGVPLSQKALAGNSYLKTDANRKTAWASRDMSKGLNAWIGNNVYSQVPKPSVKATHGALVNAARINVPVLADTYEPPGGAHYNNHPKSKQIGHWIVSDGYSHYGWTAHWHDPAQNVWRNVKVPATFNAATALFNKTFLQSNGIAF